MIIVPSVDQDGQRRLFAAALEQLRLTTGLVNKVLEASFVAERVRLELYDWPSEAG